VVYTQLWQDYFEGFRDVEVDSWQLLGNFEEFYLIKSFPVSYFTPYIVRDRNSDSLKLDCSMRVNCLVFVCMWVVL